MQHAIKDATANNSNQLQMPELTESLSYQTRNRIVLKWDESTNYLTSLKDCPSSMEHSTTVTCTAWSTTRRGSPLKASNSIWANRFSSWWQRGLLPKVSTFSTQSTVNSAQVCCDHGSHFDGDIHTLTFPLLTSNNICRFFNISANN